jgi:hypothetical protein
MSKTRFHYCAAAIRESGIRTGFWFALLVGILVGMPISVLGEDPGRFLIALSAAAWAFALGSVIGAISAGCAAIAVRGDLRRPQRREPLRTDYDYPTSFEGRREGRGP